VKLQLVFGGQSCAQFPWTQSASFSGRLPDDDVDVAPEDDPPDDEVAPDEEPPDDDEVEGVFPLSVVLTEHAMAATQGTTKTKARMSVMRATIASAAPDA